MVNELPSAPNELAELLERATDQAHRSSEIINHIRHFVSKGTTRKGSVDIDRLVAQMCDFLDWDLRNSKVKITLDLDTQGCEILANKVQIEQVLINLIRNSLEAIQNAGTLDGHITGKTRLIADKAIQITVTDNGPGIDADMRNRLFEPFQTSKESGMGMGLSVCRSIIQAHKGKIWLDESYKNGTSFCIELPVINQAYDRTQ